MLKESIKRYNNWVYSRKKSTYIFIILITTILQTIALAIIPAVIDNNYSNLQLKLIVIFIFMACLNFPFLIWQYNKIH